MRRLAAWVVVVVVAAGCGTDVQTTTAGVKDDELTVQILAESSGTSLSLSVGLYAEGRDKYQRLLLEPGEKLVARAVGAGDLELLPSGGSVPSYLGELATPAAAAEIDFFRTAFPSALGTRVTLPPAFAIELPKEGISRARPFSLRWSPADAAYGMKLSIHGACTSAAERTLAIDTGTFTWSKADWIVVKDRDAEACPATIELRREGGSALVAPKLRGLQLFRGAQVRLLTLIASP